MAGEKKKQPDPREIYCPYCEPDIEEATYPYCAACGVTEFYCPECHEVIDRENKVCPKCGADIKSSCK